MTELLSYYKVKKEDSNQNIQITASMWAPLVKPFLKYANLACHFMQLLSREGFCARMGPPDSSSEHGNPLGGSFLGTSYL